MKELPDIPSLVKINYIKSQTLDASPWFPRRKRCDFLLPSIPFFDFRKPPLSPAAGFFST